MFYLKCRKKSLLISIFMLQTCYLSCNSNMMYISKAEQNAEYSESDLPCVGISCFQNIPLDKSIPAQQWLARFMYEDKKSWLLMNIAMNEYRIQNQDATVDEITRVGLGVFNFLNDINITNATHFDAYEAMILKQINNVIETGGAALPYVGFLLEGIARSSNINIEYLEKTISIDKQLYYLNIASAVSLRHLISNNKDIMENILKDALNDEIVEVEIIIDGQSIVIPMNRLAAALDKIYSSPEFMGCRIHDGDNNCLDGPLSHALETAGVNKLLKEVYDTILSQGGMSQEQYEKLINIINGYFNDLNQSQAIVEALLSDLNHGQGLIADGIDKNAKAVADYTNSINGFIKEKAEYEEIKRIKELGKQNYVKLKTEAIQSGIYLVSTTIGLIDPKAGKHLGILGQCTYQLVATTAKYVDMVSSIMKAKIEGEDISTAAVGSLAGVAMAGNVFAIGMKVMSLFSGSGPSQLDVILNQLVEIRKQIQNLGEVMNARFDRIDKMLAKFYDRISSDLSYIIQQGKTTNEGLLAIHTNLVSILQQLTNFQMDINEQLGDLYRQSFMDSTTTYLYWNEKHTDPNIQMTLEEYNNGQDDFYDHAVMFSDDALLAGPINRIRDYTDAGIMYELSLGPLSYNINYLNEFPLNNLNESTTLVPGRLPNPTDWIAAANSYAQIAEEHPDYAKKYRKSVYMDIINKGYNILNAFIRMSEKKRFFGDENDLSYIGLIDKYEKNMWSTKAEIEQIKNDFKSQIRSNGQPGQYYNLDNIDLWGGPSQMNDDLIQETMDSLSDHENPSSYIKKCNGNDGEYHSAIGMIAELFSYENLWPFMIAHSKKLGTANICGEIEHISTTPIENLGNFKYLFETIYEFRTKISYNGKNIAMMKGRGSCKKVDFQCPSSQAAYNISERSLEKEDIFQTEYHVVYNQVKQFLYRTIKEYYEMIAEKLNLETGKSAIASKKLSGIKSMITAYVTYGLPDFMASSDEIRYLLLGEGLMDTNSLKRLYSESSYVIDLLNYYENNSIPLFPSDANGSAEEKIVDPRKHDIITDLFNIKRVDMLREHMEAYYNIINDQPLPFNSLLDVIRRVKKIMTCENGEYRQTEMPCENDLLGYQKQICIDYTWVYHSCVESPDFDKSIYEIKKIFTEYMERSPSKEEILFYRCIIDKEERRKELINSDIMHAKLNGLYKKELGRNMTEAEYQKCVEKMLYQGKVFMDIRRDVIKLKPTPTPAPPFDCSKCTQIQICCGTYCSNTGECVQDM